MTQLSNEALELFFLMLEEKEEEFAAAEDWASFGELQELRELACEIQNTNNHRE